MTLKLHTYQELARDFLRNTSRAGLFLDLGLGKTAISLSALEEQHLPALVVAPKRVAEHVWPKERGLWRPDLSLALAVGSAKDRAAALGAGADLTVISRDNLKDARPIYKTIILDELSSFKNRASARWKYARKICKPAENVWGLTGTPTPNGLLGLWSQMFLLDQGERLGTTLTGYRARYFVPAGQLPSGVVINWRLRPEAEENIHGLLDDICLYMSSQDELDMPPVTLNVVQVALPASALRRYMELKETMVLDLELIGEEIYSAANAAILSNKLRQVTSGFIFSDAQDGSYTILHDAKIKALQEVVEGTGDNILVFYNYIPEFEMIREAFPEAMHIDDAGALKKWDAGELPMMLAHPASAGHGLNLQYGGHTAAWYSLSWDLELYLQGNGRLDRQGQVHPVVIHILEAPNTMDVVVRDNLGEKEFSQGKLLDHVRSPL
jgi:SNF2 family DNA or RNA helicase